MSKKLLINNQNNNNLNTPILDGLTHWFSKEIDYVNKKWINKINPNSSMSISNNDFVTVSNNVVNVNSGNVAVNILLDDSISVKNGITVQILFYKIVGTTWSEFLKIENYTTGYKIYNASGYFRTSGITGAPLNSFDKLNVPNYEILKSISYGFDSQGLGNISYFDEANLSSVYNNLTTVFSGEQTSFAFIKNYKINSIIKDILIYDRVLSREELQQNLNY